MDAEGVKLWLAKRARTEVMLQFFTGWFYIVVGLVAAVVVAVMASWMLLVVPINGLKIVSALTHWSIGFRFTNEKLMWMSAVLVVAMFVGQRMLLKFDLPVVVRIFLDIFQATPRMVTEGFICLRRSVQWSRVNLRVCAEALSIMLDRPQRVPLSELAHRITGFDPVQSVEELTLIEGVVSLKRLPPALSLTDDFREEMSGEEPPKRPIFGGEPQVIPCEVCGTRLRIRDPEAGRLHRCPNCLTRYKTKADRNSQLRLIKEVANETAPLNAYEGWAAHEILGVAANANVNEIKGAYRRLMKENHPDLFAESSVAERCRAQEQTKAINQAYAVLMAGKA